MKSKPKPRISIDFDSTLVRTTDLFLEYLFSVTGKKHVASETTHWSWSFEKGYSEHFWNFYNFMDTSFLRLALQPYDKYTLAVLPKILKKYPETEMVTSNEVSAHWTFKAWLKMYVPEVKMHVNCIGRHSKTPKCCLPYDILVDDKPSLVKDMEKHPDKFLFLMNAPWNSHWEGKTPIGDSGPNWVRVRSWLELETLLPAKYTELQELMNGRRKQG